LEKWKLFDVLSPTTKITGTARIAKALAIQSRGLSIGLPVLYGDSYFSSYEPSKLPSVRSYKDFHKTIKLDGSKRHFINYSLRAAVLGLRKSASYQHEVFTKFITVQFREKFSQEIYTGTHSKTHTVNFANRLRRRFLSKLGVSEFFFVLEKSNKGNLHMHMVANITQKSEEAFKRALFQSNWIALNIRGVPYPSAVDITNKYTLIMYRRAMMTKKAEELDADIKDPDFESLWECTKTRSLDSGAIQCEQYKRVEPNGIDVGLADYLSKKLTSKLFASGNWNYAISAALTKNMKPFREQLLLEGKK
jgi:hypothetical protein